MNETPKFKRWAFFFFLLLISFLLLPKAGKDLLKSNLRIQVEQQRQELLQKALVLLDQNDKLGVNEVKNELQGSVYTVSLQNKIRNLSIIQLCICSAALAGLIWVYWRKIKTIENVVFLK